MAKLTLNDVTSGYSAATVINANNDRTEAALENTLSRDGSTPNGMNASLDMNSNRVVNLGSPQSGTDAARWADVTSALAISTALPSQTGNADRAIYTDGATLSFRKTPYIYRTAAEIAASVTPTDYSYDPGYVQRYGYVADDSTDNSSAISNALLQMAQTGGSPVKFPAGVGRFATSQNIPTGGVLVGEGKSKTILRYTGSAQAFKQATPSSRIYEIRIADLSIYDFGTGTVGLDLESVSTSTFERLWIDGFTTGVRIHSPTSGYAVYNRFWDVTVNAPASSKGFVLSGTSSNANRFFGCRFNGASTVGTVAWEISDSNGNSITNCETDFAATHIALTASAPGFTDGNVIYGNRLENVTTGHSIGTNVRHTHIGGNYYAIVTTNISDSGTNTMVSDPYYATPGTSARYAAASSADGHIRLIREPSGGSSLPFMRLVDENTGAGTPITLQIETERSTGSFMRGRRGGVTIRDERADGNVALLAAGILRAVGSGTPEGSLTAPIGSTYQRTDGGAATSFYVKESGTGNTGWVGK